MANKISLGYNVKDAPRDSGSDLIEAGDYLIELNRVKHMEGKNGKNDQILLNIKVLDAASDDQKKFIGKQFLEGIVLTENAKWRMAQFLDAAYGRLYEGDDVDIDDLVEKRLMARLFVDEYENKVRTKVDRFMPLSQWTGAAPSSDKGAKKASKPASGDEEVDL